eukprot:1632431-Prymnesium_polylepis.2
MKTVAAVQRAGPPGIKVIMTGYCQPTSGYNDCKTTGHFSWINEAVRTAAAAKGAIYADAVAACGAGSSTDWSPGTHHADVIHPNPKGYCSIFTMPAMQAAFDCTPPS